MNKKLQGRINRLMPKGIPRYIRCYDNGGVDAENGSADRYTVCFTGKAATERATGCPPYYPYRVMSASPFHPQGIGMWGSNPVQPCDTMHPSKKGWFWPPAVGRKCHLGTRIRFQDLPDDCRKLVISDYKEVWNLKEKA